MTEDITEKLWQDTPVGSIQTGSEDLVQETSKTKYSKDSKAGDTGSLETPPEFGPFQSRYAQRVRQRLSTPRRPYR